MLTERRAYRMGAGERPELFVESVIDRVGIRRSASEFAIALHRTAWPSRCGVAAPVVDQDGSNGRMSWLRREPLSGVPISLIWNKKTPIGQG